MSFLCDSQQLHILELFEDSFLGKVVYRTGSTLISLRRFKTVFNKGVAVPVSSDSFGSNVFLVFYFFSSEDVKMFN